MYLAFLLLREPIIVSFGNGLSVNGFNTLVLVLVNKVKTRLNNFEVEQISWNAFMKKTHSLKKSKIAYILLVCHVYMIDII